MDVVLLIIAALLFTAWVTGLIVSIPSIGRKLFGDSNSRFPLKRSFPVKRKKAFKVS